MANKANPAFASQFRALLGRVATQGALEAGVQLEDNLSAGARSGVKYPDLPRRSSAPGQYLQEQSGDTKHAVDVRPSDTPTIKRVGIFDHPSQDQRTVEALEYGNRSGTLAGRYSVTRTRESAETHARILAGMREALR